MLLNNDSFARLEDFFDVLRIRGNGKMLKAVMFFVPVFNDFSGSITVWFSHYVSKTVFDVITRALVFVIRAGKIMKGNCWRINKCNFT